MSRAEVKADKSPASDACAEARRGDTFLGTGTGTACTLHCRVGDAAVMAKLLGVRG